MIHRRREAELVKPGINIMWEPVAKGMIVKTPWFSWYVTWNRHTRRMSFAVPHGFNWRAPLGPWRRIADLEAAAKHHATEKYALNHALHLANDRYDKIRAANHELRETLTLYRNG
jgi:hypothetical protein